MSDSGGGLATLMSGGGSTAAPTTSAPVLNTPTPANIPLQGATPQNQGIAPDQNAQMIAQLLGNQPLRGN